jgi:uncharacterized protein
MIFGDFGLDSVRLDREAMFTVKIEDIPEEGLTVDWEEQRDSLLAYLNRDATLDFSFEAPLHGEAWIKKMGKAYLVRGKVHAMLGLRCARCLKEFTYPLSSTFDLSLHPEKEARGQGEVELEDEDMEAIYFEGGEIHLSEMAYEQIFLDVPYQPLCREDCRGLCPRCGRDLNQSLCGCAKEELESGFSGLQKMKLDPS